MVWQDSDYNLGTFIQSQTYPVLVVLRKVVKTTKNEYIADIQAQNTMGWDWFQTVLNIVGDRNGKEC